MANARTPLDTIAEQLGEPCPALPDPVLGTAEPGPLVAGDDPRLFAALVELTRAPGGGFAEHVARELTGGLGVLGHVTFFASSSAACRAALGAEPAVGLAPLVAAPDTVRLLERASRAFGDARSVVYEPRFEDPEDERALRAALAAANEQGLRIVADETRTAGRTAPGAACRALDLPWDEMVVGDSFAGGRPFGARIVRGSSGVRVADASPLSVLLAGATACVLRSAPASLALGVHGASLRSAFLAACARESIDADIVGPPGLGRFVLRGQEGVSAELLTSHAGLEIERLGARASPWIVPHARWDRLAPDLHRVLDAAMGRLRTRLVEANSYLSGGLPFPFAGNDPALAARGLAVYRYPKRGPVDVFADGDRIRIRFAAGELGPIVSSGFYLPTRLVGDFDVCVEYELHGFAPGPDSACFALFFQNELSTGRYYAQRTATPDGAHSVRASFDGALSTAHDVTGARGAFRLARAGAGITAWHRAGTSGPWLALGRTDRATTDDGILGAKIWSKIACGGLEASLFDLRASVTLAPVQDPAPAVVPDPRGAP